jgi:ADP-dependent phosphofructokinase/glucokinase
MDIEEWEKRYSMAFSGISDILGNINGIFVAYNSNIDAIKHVSEKDIRKLISIVGAKAVQHRVVDYPREIQDPVDLVARLVIAMRDGKAAEVPTYTTDIHQWLMDSMVFDKARMGGQAGIISNLLANLGLNNVITYVPYLSKEQAEYFVDAPNLKYPVIEDGVIKLRHPLEVYDVNQPPKVNWILEFSKGTKVEFAEETFEVPRDNRLIISSRPSWLRIDMSEQLCDQIPHMNGVIDGAILAGYQMIKEEYDDGATYRDYVGKAVKVIERLKEGNPDMRIHVEFTSIQNKVIRKTILKDIVYKRVSSLGLDTVEVANALNVLGHEELAYAVISKGENSISALYEGAVKLLCELNLERVHIHSLGFYICVASRDFPLSVEEHRDALMFSSALAAAQALHGGISSLKEAESGLSVPIYRQGHHDLEQLEKYLVRRDVCTGDEFEDGCVCALNHDFVVIPTKVVPDPVATVGIGDTISAGAFVAILAMLRKKQEAN